MRQELLLKNKNYFVFSGWTANLGVVPLLLFAALRLVPIFTFLADLLFFVTRVFETIYKLPHFLISSLKLNNSTPNEVRCHRLPSSQKNISNLNYLSKISFYVKRFAVLLFLYPQLSMALTQNQVDTLTLARGELHRAHFDNMQKFPIGNKEVIKVKVDGSYLIIKALSLGASDLLIWQGSKKPMKIKVFVISKRQEATLQMLALDLKKLELPFHITGQTYTIAGELKSKKQLVQLRTIESQHPNKINLDNTNLSHSLKRENYQRFIIDALELYGDELDCEPSSLYISCFDIPQNPSVKKFLGNKYLIEWKPNELKNQQKQYLIKLKLYQFENFDGQQFSLGLYQAAGTLENIIVKSPLSLINKNTIALKKSHFEFSTLAEPTIIGRLGHPIQIKLGSEIPYSNTNREGQTTTQWRFAGLSIDLKLKPKGDKLLIEYSNNLSRPNQEAIQSNKQSSSLIAKPGSENLIFNIGFLVTDEQQNQLPGLHAIPLLGKLFSSSENSKVFKKVLGFIEIKEL
jgi:hypothetical protein